MLCVGKNRNVRVRKGPKGADQSSTGDLILRIQDGDEAGAENLINVSICEFKAFSKLMDVTIIRSEILCVYGSVNPGLYLQASFTRTVLSLWLKYEGTGTG